MIRAWAVLLLVGLLGGCAPDGEGAPDGEDVPDAGEVSDAEEVPDGGEGRVGAGDRKEVAMSHDETLALFGEVWTSDILPGRPDARDFDGLVQSPPIPPSVHDEAFRAIRARLVDALGDPPPEDLVLYGQLRELDRDGVGHVVHFDALLDSGLSGCVDPVARRVLLVWINPEG